MSAEKPNAEKSERSMDPFGILESELKNVKVSLAACEERYRWLEQLLIRFEDRLLRSEERHAKADERMANLLTSQLSTAAPSPTPVPKTDIQEAQMFNSLLSSYVYSAEEPIPETPVPLTSPDQNIS